MRPSSLRTRKGYGGALALALGASLVFALLMAVVAPYLAGKQLANDLQAWAEEHGASARVTSWRRHLFARLPERIHVQLPGGTNLDSGALRLALVTPLGFRFVADDAHLLLRGAPEQLWGQWLKWRAGLDFAVRIKRLAVEYVDPTVGRLQFRDFETAARGQELRCSAKRLEFGRQSWDDVVFTIARPFAVVTARLDEPAAATKPIEFRYVPSSGKAAEWFIDIPSRSFPLAIERLQAGSAAADSRTRISGVITITIPDDAAKPKRAVGQFVFDDWFVPEWPDAQALTGTSGAIAVRAQPLNDTSTWSIGRVDVAAGPFNLVGKGELAFAEAHRLRFEASGRRTCTELASQVRPSKYKDQVRAYLASPANAQDTKAIQRGSAETVELGLALSMTAGTPGRTMVSWHLSPGCGIGELNGVRTW